MKKKKILILGSSSDIGVQLIRQLLKDNWIVYAHYNKSKKALKEFKNKIKSININFSSSNSQIKKQIKKIQTIDFEAYINLVGFIDNKSFENFDIDNLMNSLKVNSVVPIFILKKIIKKMIKNKKGRIVQSSSIGVKFGGGSNTFNYSLSKHLNEFIPRDFKKWAKNNVLINTLRIGVTNTKIHKKINKKNLKKRISLIPINRMAETKEIVELIKFLISDKNTYITGQTINISGGE